MDAIGIADPVWQTTFPHRVVPRSEEWLAGVILRCDEANGWTSGTTLAHLLRTAGTDSEPAQLSLILPRSSLPLAPLAGWLAIPESALITSTYQLELARLYDVVHPHLQLLDMGLTLHVCPLCLSEAQMLRRSLVLPHMRCCLIHHVYLQSSCPCGTSLWRRLFSSHTQPFTCHKCGLAWAAFPKREAESSRIALEQRLLAWYEFFFSKGSRMLLARALQLIQRTMEERQMTSVKRLNGRSLRVTFSGPEKTSLGRLVDVLVSLDLSSEDLEADESPLLWRPINWQTFYCPVPTCPYMRPIDAGETRGGETRC